MELAPLPAPNQVEMTALRPSKATELKGSIAPLSCRIEAECRDVQRAYKLLTGTEGLKDAFVVAIAAHGKSSLSIADSLFCQNSQWGQKSSTGELKPFASSVISRLRKALAYIEPE